MNAVDKDTVVIVDPYSSGSLLAPEFSANGYNCLAVKSTHSIPPLLRSSFDEGQFGEIVQHDHDVEDTLKQIGRHNVKLVIPGCETGIELADELGERLNLPSNGTKGSGARRDKFLMLENVRKAKLSVPKQIKASNPDEILQWIQVHCQWPVIVKPTTSSASDSVFLCKNGRDVQCAMEQTLFKSNKLGLINTSVVAQEFIAGTEFIVDTVSVDGVHKVAALWRYSKPSENTKFICYDCMEYLQPDGKIQQQLFSYTKLVLNALELRYGPAHCEIMWKDGKPFLIEVNARLNARRNATIGRSCSDLSHLDLAVEAYTEPEKFLSRPSSSYRLTKRVANYFLIPKQEGKLIALPRLNEIEQLESFHELSIGVRPGNVVSGVIGVVTLLHADKRILRKDIQKMRELQESGFYLMESQKCTKY